MTIKATSIIVLVTLLVAFVPGVAADGSCIVQVRALDGKWRQINVGETWIVGEDTLAVGVRLIGGCETYTIGRIDDEGSTTWYYQYVKLVEPEIMPSFLYGIDEIQIVTGIGEIHSIRQTPKEIVQQIPVEVVKPDWPLVVLISLLGILGWMLVGRDWSRRRDNNGQVLAELEAITELLTVNTPKGITVVVHRGSKTVSFVITSKLEGENATQKLQYLTYLLGHEWSRIQARTSRVVIDGIDTRLMTCRYDIKPGNIVDITLNT